VASREDLDGGAQFEGDAQFAGGGAIGRLDGDVSADGVSWRVAHSAAAIGALVPTTAFGAPGASDVRSSLGSASERFSYSRGNANVRQADPSGAWCREVLRRGREAGRRLCQ
jgi:hypothetical protein